MNRRRAFTLTELIVAIGFFAVAILAVLGLSLAINRLEAKSANTNVGKSVASQILQRTLSDVRADQPPGARANFWDSDHLDPPWDEGVQLSDHTRFNYTVTCSTVSDTAGDEIGHGIGGNRLKKVDVLVTWWNAEEKPGREQGPLEVTATQLVSESN